MAGSPLRRERKEREAAERATGVADGVAKRATVADPATRAAAVQRASEVGSAQAAREFGVQTSTIRSWRKRVAAEPPAPTATEPAEATPVAPAEPGEITSVDELSAFARDLMTSARVSQRAIERAVREGKNTGAYHLSLATGIQLDKIGTLVAAVERLRETSGLSSERELARLTERLRGFLHEGNIDADKEPWAALMQRWFVGAMPTVAVAPAQQLPEHGVETVTAEVVPDDDTGGEDIEEASVVEPEPTTADAEQLDDDITASESPEVAEQATDTEPADIPDVELVPLTDIPLSFRHRFQLGDAGQRRAQVAWTRQVREQQQAAEVAEKAEREAAAAQAPRRVSSARHTPLPRGWEHGGTHGGHGRGRGPAGTAGGW